MRVLLLSMPDAFEHTPPLTMRMPNGALASLAGNVDPHHEVAIADLILARDEVPGTVRRLLAQHRPDVVGLSIMTFQRLTAQRVIALVRAEHAAARIVVGGYDPSLAPDVWEVAGAGVDAVVRGEGDHTFRELLRAWESEAGLDGIAGLSYRCGDRFVRNPPRPVSHLGEDVRPPNRGARVLAVRQHQRRSRRAHAGADDHLVHAHLRPGRNDGHSQRHGPDRGDGGHVWWRGGRAAKRRLDHAIDGRRA